MSEQAKKYLKNKGFSTDIIDMLLTTTCGKKYTLDYLLDEHHKEQLEKPNNLLKIALGMLNNITCINGGCDGNGVIQVAEDDFEQCQWCYEKEQIKKYLKTIEK